MSSDLFNGYWYCTCGAKGNISKDFYEHMKNNSFESHRMIGPWEYEVWEDNKKLRHEVKELKEKVHYLTVLRNTMEEISAALNNQLVDGQAKNDDLQEELTQLRTYMSKHNIDIIENEQPTEHSRLDAQETRRVRPEIRPENRPGIGQRRLHRRRSS